MWMHVVLVIRKATLPIGVIRSSPSKNPVVADSGTNKDIKEAEDIYDVIDWCSLQSWCSGSVGMA
jgi:hypothetical protein